MSETMKIYIAARTNTGRVRSHNEDDFLVCRSLDLGEWFFDNNEVIIGKKGALFAIADGMGGEEAGEVASRIAIETIKEKFLQLENKQYTDRDACEFLEKVIHAANNAIITVALTNPAHARMGTTIVIVWIQEFRAYIAWVGDSRCYLSRNERLTLTTDDHAPVWELVKKGKISAEEARAHPDSNFISQHLGQTKDPIKPDTKTLVLQKSDILLLCSDGLNAMLSDSQIETFINKNKAIGNTCTQLIDAANNAGGYDNITAILVEIYDEKRAAANETAHVKSPKTTASIDENFFENTPAVKRKSGNQTKVFLYFLLALVLAAVFLKFWTKSIFQIKTAHDKTPAETITNAPPEGTVEIQDPIPSQPETSKTKQPYNSTKKLPVVNPQNNKNQQGNTVTGQKLPPVPTPLPNKNASAQKTQVVTSKDTANKVNQPIQPPKSTNANTEGNKETNNNDDNKNTRPETETEPVKPDTTDNY